MKTTAANWILATLLVLLILAARRRIHGWGATDKERTEPLPGDDLLQRSRGQVTYAITISASASEVWPWLVQMGCHRGGWYSYDRLDNGGESSATRILPQFQNLHVGDRLPAVPGDPGGFEVALIDPERSLVLRTNADLSGPPDIRPPLPFRILGSLARLSGAPAAYWNTTWSFVVRDQLDHSTRLIVRNHADFEPYWVLKPFVESAVLPIHHLMQRKQLLGIKARCEGEAVA